MSDRNLRRLIIGLPFLWLGLFFAAPFAIVLRMAFSEVATAIPPYQPVFTLAEGPAAWLDKLRLLTGANFVTIANDRLYPDAFLTSLRIAATGTAIILVIGLPMAHAMARAPQAWKPLLLMAVILPFWTSFLIRAYAWIGILKPEGTLNAVLLALGLIGEPLRIADSEIMVMIGVVYCYLPFMVLPLFAKLDRADPRLLEAAADLGCPPVKAFFLITVPLAMPGIIAGSFLCFIPIMGEVIIPDLLGGPDTLMVGKTLWTEFFSNRDWPVASAVAVVLLVVLIGPILAYQRVQSRLSQAAR